MLKLNSGVCTSQILWECVPNCWSAQTETGSQAKSTAHMGQRGHRGLLVIIANEQQRCLQDVRQRLVSALLLPRVDYCNSSLAGLPAIALAPLQRVLNAATCYVADLHPHDHVTLVQHTLHSAYNTNCVFFCMVPLTGMHQTTSPIWLHWHQLRRAGHIFALLTASPLNFLNGFVCGYIQ